MKIKLEPEQMSVNDKAVSIMDSMLDIIARYNAELAEANRNHTEARQAINKRLVFSVKTINERYEEKLLRALHK